MASGKTEQQLKVPLRAEYKVGKIEQQRGAKPTVAYKRRERVYKTAVQKQTRLKKEVESFQNKALTYSNYGTEYNKLSAEAKKYLTSPSKVKQSEGYKEYANYQSKLQSLAYDKRMYKIAYKLATEGKWSLGLKGKYLDYYKEVRRGIYGDIISQTHNEMKKVEKWMEENKMTPTPETIRDIISEPITKPTKEIPPWESETGILGQPIFQSPGQEDFFKTAKVKQEKGERLLRDEKGREGLIFLREEESKQRGTELKKGDYPEFFGQGFITQAEEITGIKKGESGAVALLPSEMNFKPYDEEKAFKERESKIPFSQLSMPGMVRQSFFRTSKKLLGEKQFDIFPGKREFLFKPSEFAGEVALFAGFSPLMESSSMMSKGLARQSQQITFKQLEGTPFKTKAVSIGTKDKSLIKIKGGKEDFGFKQEIDITGNLFKTKQKNIFGLEGKGFVIPKGEMKVVTSGKFEYDMIGASGKIEQPFMIDVKSFGVGAKSVTGQDGKFSTALTKFVQISQTKKPTTDINFGFGIAEQKTAKGLFETGIEGVKIKSPLGKYYTTEGFKVTDWGKVMGERWMDLKFSSYGAGKNIYFKLPKTRTDVGFKGGGNKLSPGAFKQLYSSEQKAIPSSILSAAKVTPSIKTIKLPTTTRVSTPAISKFAGTGLYERTENYGSGIPGKMSSGIKTYTPLKTDVKTTISPLQSTKFNTLLKESSKMSSALKSKSREGLRQPVNVKEIMDTKFLLKTPQKINLKQLSKTKQISKLKPIPEQRLITTPTTSRTRFIPERNFPIGISKSRLSPIRSSTRKRTYKRKPTSVYRKPSLVALGFNIRVPKIKKRETAFSIRPIITKKKKKRKKK